MKIAARILGPTLMWIITWGGCMFYMTRGKPLWILLVCAAASSVVSAVMCGIMESRDG